MVAAESEEIGAADPISWVSAAVELGSLLATEVEAAAATEVEAAAAAAAAAELEVTVATAAAELEAMAAAAAAEPEIFGATYDECNYMKKRVFLGKLYYITYVIFLLP